MELCRVAKAGREITTDAFFEEHVALGLRRSGRRKQCYTWVS
jgi:hypothetical protein